MGEEGRLVTLGEYLPHQCLGVVRALEGSSVFCTGSGGVSGDGSDEQYNRSGIHLQARRHQIQEFHAGDSQPLQLVGGTPDNPQVQAYIPGCLNVVADSLSRDGQILTTE